MSKIHIALYFLLPINNYDNYIFNIIKLHRTFTYKYVAIYIYVTNSAMNDQALIG